MENPKLRSQDEIVAEFDALVAQRDGAPEYSAARNMLNDRIRALGWALSHPLVNSLVLTKNEYTLYEVLS